MIITEENPAYPRYSYTRAYTKEWWPNGYGYLDLMRGGNSQTAMILNEALFKGMDFQMPMDGGGDEVKFYSDRGNHFLTIKMIGSTSISQKKMWGKLACNLASRVHKEEDALLKYKPYFQFEVQEYKDIDYNSLLTEEDMLAWVYTAETEKPQFTMYYYRSDNPIFIDYK